MPQMNLGYTGLSVKKPDSKDCTLCCFFYMTFWKVQIYRGQKLVDFQSLELLWRLRRVGENQIVVMF